MNISGLALCKFRVRSRRKTSPVFALVCVPKLHSNNRHCVLTASCVPMAVFVDTSTSVCECVCGLAKASQLDL